MREELVSSTTVFEGRIVKVRVDQVRLGPEGRAARREVVGHPGAVAVVAVTPDGEVVLVRQFRYAAGEELLEVPAGTLEPGEEPADCARRELAEETGRTAGGVELLASLYTSPGFCDEVIHVFLARLDGTPARPQSPDEDERLYPITVPLAAALKMAGEGRLRDAKTVAGLWLAAARLGNGAAAPALEGPGTTA